MAVAAVLTLSGCGGDNNGDRAQQPTAIASDSARPTGTAQPSGSARGASPSPSPSPTTTTPSPTGSDTPSAVPTTGVEGVWLATSGGTKVQLVLGSDGKAGLTSTHLCGGAFTDKNGIGLTMTCMDGDKERTSGHGVLATDGKTLTVKWTNGPTDTFSRTGLPSN
ncbi:hypothetical protein [Streptomyces sp. NBC_01190]|uniref:hypothetical protein n=1 Tax=Streptomyces sp. NBC_01190 TaxID=2903767 RepID=UPI0038643CB3|nr:hypothetical protein OG519_12855 [Streptomyces sp. NBC_01190]